MTKIDDEMVKRLCKHAKLYANGLVILEPFARELLEAALSPKPEPEIEVSEGMENAGLNAYWSGSICGLIASGWNEKARKQIANVFRAMLKQQAMEAAYAAKSAPQGDYGEAAVQTIGSNIGRWGDAAPVKETGGGVKSGHLHWRNGDGGWSPHRRKDDPPAAQQFYGMTRD